MAGELTIMVLVLVLMALLFWASRRAKPGGRASSGDVYRSDIYGGDIGTAYVAMNGAPSDHASHAHGPPGAHDHAPGPGSHAGYGAAHDGGASNHGGDAGGGGHSGGGDGGGGAGGDGGGGGVGHG